MKARVRIGGVLVGLAALGISAAGTGATPAPSPSAEEIIARSRTAFLYAGDDMRARVTMRLIDRKGRSRERVLTLLRKNMVEGEEQRVFLYFHEPGDVRGITFMAWTYPGREDERWIFIPSLDLVRRIAAEDKRSRFVGSDFTYEDVSGRDLTADTHRLLRQEEIDGRSSFVVESVPKDPVEYVKQISWIDSETFLPLKEEYLDAGGELVRVFTADRVENIPAGGGEDGKVIPTVLQRTMRNLETGHRTEVRFDAVDYGVGLSAEDFSERHMRRPPPSWIR